MLTTPVAVGMAFSPVFHADRTDAIVVILESSQASDDVANDSE